MNREVNHRQFSGAYSRRQRSGGFIMLIAVLMLGIVAAAIAVLTAAMSNDARRTENHFRDAQLEQMLLAANADAPTRMSLNPAANQTWNVDLPPSLSDSGATVTTRVQAIPSPDQATLLVRATFDRRLAEQTIQLHRDAGKWRIISTHLDNE